jgi:hypothetical protein
MITRTLSLVLLLASGFFAYGQKAVTFNEAKAQGLSSAHLDSLYASGLSSDPTLGVFKNNQAEYIKSYQNLLQDLGKYLKKNNFDWVKPVKGFNRIYFDKSGKIDYFLYSFHPDQLTANQENRFGELLAGFIVEYRFQLSADKNFSQCSAVTYMPIDK